MLVAELREREFYFRIYYPTHKKTQFPCNNKKMTLFQKKLQKRPLSSLAFWECFEKSAFRVRAQQGQNTVSLKLFKNSFSRKNFMKLISRKNLTALEIRITGFKKPKANKIFPWNQFHEIFSWKRISLFWIE